MSGEGEGEVIACHTLDIWNEEFESAKESNKLIVIDFTATWCGPCRLIAPLFAKMAKKFTNVVFFKIDVDELQSVAEEFQVEAIPTLVFLKEGEVVDTIVGPEADKIYETLINHGGIDASG